MKFVLESKVSFNFPLCKVEMVRNISGYKNMVDVLYHFVEFLGPKR